jgi:hypothetical protein
LLGIAEKVVMGSIVVFVLTLFISACGMQGSIKPIEPTDTTVANPSTTPTSSSGFVNGGNSFQANSSLGNLDNYNLGFLTNGLPRLTILSSGNVGIGTTAPVDLLSFGSVNASATRSTINFSNSALVAGSASGTYLGANQPTEGADFIHFQVANDTRFHVASTGVATFRNGGLRLEINPNFFGRSVISSALTPIHISTNGTTSGLWVDVSSGVTVNATTPSAALDVYNPSAMTNSFAVASDATSTGNIFIVKTNGRVGIGNNNPSYQLQLSTDSAAKPGTSTWTIASDERLKDVRAPFRRGLEDLLGLNTVYFKYKEDNPLGLPSNKEFVGIRAQDALKVIPESISKDDQGYLHVTNDSIIWTAVNAIKELYRKFLKQDEQLSSQARQLASKADKAAVDARLEQLEAENAELRARLEKLEKSLGTK